MKNKKQVFSKNKTEIRNIYELYLERVYAYVGFRVGNESDTEDIVSEIFLSISRNITSVLESTELSVGAWIFTIARNKIIDFYRKENRAPNQISIDDIPNLASNHQGPEENILQKERFLILYRLIDALPKRQQEVITLRLFAQLKNKEISGLLGIHERTVSAYLSRAVKQLEIEYAKVIETKEEYFNEVDHG